MIYGWILSGISLPLLLIAEARSRESGERSVGIWIFKPLCSLGFVLSGVMGGIGGRPGGGWMLAALALCMLGDILLIPRGRRDIFLGGVLAFLAGHLCFGLAFLSGPVSGQIDRAAAAAGALPFLLIGAAVLGAVRRGIPDMLKGAVLLYTVVISGMVGLATGSAWADGSQWCWIAAIAFALSDVSVALDRFAKTGLWNRLWGVPLYFGAVHLFVWGWLS